MARAAVEDPIKVFRFRVVIDGFARMGFSEVSGLEMDTEVVEYREGGDNESPRKSPGLTKFTDITLKRGQIIPGAVDFEDWMKQVHTVSVEGNDSIFRRELTIEQYDATNTLARTWKVSEAWPRKWVPTSTLAASSNDNSFEELVLAHEGFERI